MHMTIINIFSYFHLFIMLNIASQTTISYSQINLADIKEPSTSIIENENVLYPKLSIIESIFEFYKSLYFSKELRGRSIPFQKSKAVILNTLFVGQMISLFWVPEMNIHG